MPIINFFGQMQFAFIFNWVIMKDYFLIKPVGTYKYCLNQKTITSTENNGLISNHFGKYYVRMGSLTGRRPHNNIL